MTKRIIKGLFLWTLCFAFALSMGAKDTDFLLVGPVKQKKVQKVKILVVEKETKEPIFGATVKSEQAKSPQITDLNGECILSLKKPYDKVKLQISAIGFVSMDKDFVLDAQSPLVIELKGDAKLIGQVVVEGQKREASLLQQSATISASALEKSPALSLAKMLEQVPGVSSISAGSSVSKPVIQGMHSSRIVLINNGVRLESQSWGQDHAPEIDHTGASIVEVIKGAESVRYGHGAVGGVVLFNQAPLHYGSDKFLVKGRFNLGYATNGRAYDGAGSIDMGYKEFALRLHGMYQRSGDYHTAQYGMWNTGFTNIALSAHGGWRHENITATIYSSLYTSRSGIYRFSTVSDPQLLLVRFKIGRPDSTQIRPFSYQIEPPFQQSQHFTLKGEVEWKINEDHKLDFKVSYQDNLRQEFENRKRDDISWLPVQDLLLTTYATDIAWEGKWNDSHSSMAGVSGLYQYNYNFPGTKQPAFIPNYAALTMGVFAVHKAKFNDLQLSGGIRYDYRAMDVYGYTSVNLFKKYHEFKLYASFTGNLAAYYQFNDNWSVKVNAGLAWRPPDINELYATGIHHSTYWVVGNRKLLPEIGIKPVVGLKFQNDWIVVEPSAFYQYVHNYIYDNIGQGLDRFQDHPSGRYPRFIFEQDNARLFGGDVMATIRPIENLDVTLRGEWINARNITHNTWLPFMPSDRYGLDLQYEIDFGRNKEWHASVAMENTFVTKQKRFDPTKDLAPDSPPAYFLMNANADVCYDFANGMRVKFMFLGDNVLNALYKEYTDRFRFFAHAMGAKYTFRTVFEF